MSLRGFIESSRRLLRRSTKPSRRDLWMIFKVCVLGTITIGIYAFLVEFMAVLLSGIAVQVTLPPELPLYLAAAVIVALIMIFAYGKRAGWW